MTAPSDTEAPDNDPVDTDSLLSTAQAAIAGARSIEEIRQVAASVSGKRSPLAEASRRLGALEPAARKALGQQIHQARTAIDGLLEQRRNDLEREERSRQMAEARMDLTEFIPGSIPAPAARGHLHLVSQTRDSLEDVFVALTRQYAGGPA